MALAPAINSAPGIAIADTGLGIPADRMHRLFSPFDRLGAEQHGIEGTGLGLAVTKRLCEAMNGSITAESRDGNGSTFTVRFPIAETVAGQTPAVAELEAHSPLPNHPMATVLYIEDNLSNLKLVKSVLAKRSNIHLISALKGTLGIELAQKHKPDCVLLDIHLPDMLGNEVAERLARDPTTKDIPIIVLSADATQGQKERLHSLGVLSYLTKPLEVKQFLSILDSVLTGVKNAQEPART